MSDTTKLAQLKLPAATHRVLGSYWRPSPAFVDELAQFLGGSRVLEVFAGNGFLAGLLAARGINIKATTRFSSHDAHEAGLYFPVEEAGAVSAVCGYGDNYDVLLMSWPTVTHSALHAVAEWGTEKDIIYIGEVTDRDKGRLGGCATDEFFEQMRFTKRFETYEGNFMEAALVGRYDPSGAR